MTPAIPKTQIFTLLALQAVVAFSFECIFPFVNQFLLDIGVVKNPEDAGFYSGVVESAFAISQLITVFPAAWASDIYGRKPVIILGTLGVALAMAIFGVSTTYWMMILSRVLGGGVGAGNTAIRVMSGEMTGKASQPRVFSWIVISYRIGQIVGQPVGGLLSHPERHWPKLFSSWFWHKYPYALPCFVGSAYALLCSIVGQLVLKETLRSRSKGAKIARDGGLSGEASPLLEDTPISSPKKLRPTIRSVLTWPLFSLLVSNAIMVLLTEVFFATYPLFAFTPIELGGLGLSEARIGIHMSVRSVVHIVILFPFSRLQERFSAMSLYRVSLIAWIPTIMLFPILSFIARNRGEDGVWWYLGLAVVFSVWAITGWSWASVFVLSSGHSPNEDAMATVQALVSSCVIIPQAIGPALGTSTFAFAIQHREILRGNFFWVSMLVLSVIAVLHSLTLRESSHDRREEESRDTSRQEII